jgi:hypothetical protein
MVFEDGTETTSVFLPVIPRLFHHLERVIITEQKGKLARPLFSSGRSCRAVVFISLSPDPILRMHELCTPIKVITEQLHLPQDTVRFVVKRGRLPQQPLSFSSHVDLCRTFGYRWSRRVISMMLKELTRHEIGHDHRAVLRRHRR